MKQEYSMKYNAFKPLLWLTLSGILAWFILVIPALADGAGWPTSTPFPTLIRLVTSTSPFGGAVTPVIAITPIGKDQNIQAGDQALLPTMFRGTTSATTQTSGGLKITGILGLVIAAIVLLLLFFLILRR
jgi:hypothetical protein